MKTFNFEITFTCPYLSEVKTIIKQYKTADKQSAIAGMIDYCNTNKNMINATSELLKQV